MELEEKSDLVFGIHPIIEGLESDKTFDKILILNTLRIPQAKEIMALAREKGVSLNKVPQQKLDRITRKNHQGIIGFIAPVEFQNIEDIFANAFRAG